MVLAYSWRSRLKSPEEIKTFKSLIEVAKQRYNTNDQMLNELVSESVWRTYNGPYSITSNSVSKLSADESQRLHLLMANFWFVAGYNKGSVFAKDIINYVLHGSFNWNSLCP